MGAVVKQVTTIHRQCVLLCCFCSTYSVQVYSGYTRAICSFW